MPFSGSCYLHPPLIRVTIPRRPRHRLETDAGFPNHPCPSWTHRNPLRCICYHNSRREAISGLAQTVAEFLRPQQQISRGPPSPRVKLIPSSSLSKTLFEIWVLFNSTKALTRQSQQSYGLFVYFGSLLFRFTLPEEAYLCLESTAIICLPPSR